MRYPLLTLALAGLLASSVPAGDWTGFRGPNGVAVSVEKDLPVKWGPAENLRWKVALPGRGLSNPIIVDGKVLVTACSGFKQRRLHVLCFEEATGKKLWERQFTATGNTACHPTTNMAAPTPVSDGQAVYALFATGDLAALDLDGTLRWYRSLVSDYPDITNQVGMASSPALWKDVLLLPLENAGESFAAGLDTRTGKNLWKVAREKCINWVSPVLTEAGGQPAAVFYTPKDVTGYDPRTGQVLWSLTDRGGSEMQSPAQGNGLVFVPGRDFLALRPSKDVSIPEVVWKSNKLGGGGGASPVYHDGRIYAMTSTGLRCADAKDGKEIWLQRVEGPAWASPVIADGKAYVTSETGAVTVIELGKEPKVLAKNNVGQPLLATPAVANGALYLRSDSSLFCVGGSKPK